jgi:hypothetical protein
MFIGGVRSAPVVVVAGAIVLATIAIAIIATLST